jgi:G3E family GTPase
VFHLDEVFDRRKLIEFLGEISSVVRVKGIFHCDGNWWSINRAKNAVSYTESTWRRDSRLEIILSDAKHDWVDFERRLLDCRPK